MMFDTKRIADMVRSMASRMLPGWSYELLFAASTAELGGALGMVEPMPERKKFKMWLAPHPPGERVEETIPHELTHVMLSPLTHLLPANASVVMIEEMIVEPLGCELAKLLDTMPQYARAMIRALQSPRTTSQTMRKRISALAARQRNEGRNRSMIDSTKLAELAMKAGELGAREDVPDDVRALLAEFVAAMAGGDAGPGSAPMREDNPDDGKGAPPMREEEVPAAMRAQYRTMQRLATTQLDSTIRMRINELRTVDKLEITPVIEAKLRKARTIEDFEDRLELVKASLGASTEQRKRSGAEPDGNGGRNGSPSIESLRRDYPTQIADDIHRNYEKGAEFGDVALKAASKFRKVAANG
jgi:hypothetical protein